MYLHSNTTAKRMQIIWNVAFILFVVSPFLFSDSMGLHRVENPSHTDPAVSLHLYCPPFDTCHMFDQRTGKKTAAKISFWSKFGERVPTVCY